MKLKFHDYDYFLSLPYYQNEDNVKAEADKYIQHKIDRDGYYSYSGYPSVTSVLSMMNPDQEAILERWRAKLRRQGLDPAKVSRNYADIGTAIHYAIGSRISFPVELEPPKWHWSSSTYWSSTFTTTMWVIVRVHNRSTYCWSDTFMSIDTSFSNFY